MRVLIGNVDPDLTRVLSELLREYDDSIEVASVGSVDQIHDHADLYLLVLNNIGPLSMSASERAERVLLRAQELHGAVIILAGAPDDAEERTRAAGFRHFFSLPFDVRALLDAVREEVACGQSSKQPAGLDS